ncbi:MAG: adenosylcobinamide-GDP ribazoletransferase [Anaerolineales bacterium]
MRGLRLALGFLTTLPVRPPKQLTPGDLGRAAAWYPLIGLAMGGILWWLSAGLSAVFPSMLKGALLLAAWVAMSGGLHLDGWADCCDGLFVSAPQERRLAILRDTQLGTFAAVGLFVLLALKLSALASLAEPQALLLAPALGRGLLLPLAKMKPARPEGLGAALHRELNWASFLPLALVLLTALWVGPRGLAAVAVGLVVGLLWGWLARRRLGGHTGDVLGGACELIELSVLFVFLWRIA